MLSPGLLPRVRSDLIRERVKSCPLPADSGSRLEPYDSTAFMRSGENGTPRMRTPVASKMALQWPQRPDESTARHVSLIEGYFFPQSAAGALDDVALDRMPEAVRIESDRNRAQL